MVKQPIYLRPEEAPKLPDGWKLVRSDELVLQLKPGKLFDSKTVVVEGTVPVFNQSEDGVLGFHNEQPGGHAACQDSVFGHPECFPKG